MKKLLTLLTALLLLTGCSNGSAKITDGSAAVVTLGDQSLTRNELYGYMNSVAGSYFAVTSAHKFVLDAEVPATEEMIASAEATLTSYEGMLGEQYEYYILSMGYASIDAFKETLVQNAQLTALYNKYITENFTTLSAKYAPKKIQLMTFDNEDAANIALDAINSGADFVTTASDNGSSVSGEATVITNQTSYETVVQYEINNLKANETSSQVIVNDDASKFYIVRVLESDPTAFQEEAVNAISAISSISNEAVEHYFKIYKFKIYDYDLYNALVESYENLISK